MAGNKGFKEQSFDMDSGGNGKRDMNYEKYEPPVDNYEIKGYGKQKAEIDSFADLSQSFDMNNKGGSKVGGRDNGNRVNIPDFGTQGYEMNTGMKEPEVDVKKYAYPVDSINIKEYPTQGTQIAQFPKSEPIHLKSRGRIDTIDMSSKVGGKHPNGSRAHIPDFGTQGFEMDTGMKEPEVDINKYAYPVDSINIREYPTQGAQIMQFPKSEPIHLKSRGRIDTIDMSSKVGGNGKNSSRIKDFGTQGFDMSTGMKEPEVDIKKYAYPEDKVNIKEYPSNGMDIPNFPKSKPVHLKSRRNNGMIDMNSKVGGFADDDEEMLESAGRSRKRSRDGSMGVAKTGPVNIHMK